MKRTQQSITEDDPRDKIVVKHPIYGAFSVSRADAATVDEAIELYRVRKCGHITAEALKASGLRTNVAKFTPADTEVGK